MTSGPALGILELSSIARGIVAVDALVKRAEVSVLSAGPTTPGKYVIVFAGGEAEVHESICAAIEVADGMVIDSLELPSPDPSILPAIIAESTPPDSPIESLGVLELTGVAAAVRSLDAALKAANVRLVHLHLARGIGGKGYWLVSGALHDVEAAIEHGDAACLPIHRVGREIVPRPHADIGDRIDLFNPAQSRRF